MFAGEKLQAAHKRSIHNEDEVKRSIECGCFYCFSVFRPSEICDWVEEAPPTALCPKCGIDAVIGDASGYPIHHEKVFLAAMHDRWFSSV